MHIHVLAESCQSPVSFRSIKVTEFAEFCAFSSKRLTLNMYSFVIWLSWGLKCSPEPDISGTTADTLLNLMTPFLTSMLKGSSAAVIF